MGKHKKKNRINYIKKWKMKRKKQRYEAPQTQEKETSELNKTSEMTSDDECDEFFGVKKPIPQEPVVEPPLTKEEMERKVLSDPLYKGLVNYNRYKKKILMLEKHCKF